MIVRIYPGAFIGFTAAFLHRCFFREHDPGATYCVFSQAHKMPVGACSQGTLAAASTSAVVRLLMCRNLGLLFVGLSALSLGATIS